MNIKLTQSEADDLLKMEKYCVDRTNYKFPYAGKKLMIPLQSRNGGEKFSLDIYRGRIVLNKVTYQNRARQVVVLARIDLNGSPHLNPDGKEIPCPHLHIYKEGYGDKWAIPIPTDDFSNPNDLWQTLEDFMRYCNIVELPKIDRELFL